jgi:hypothetical protein
VGLGLGLRSGLINLRGFTNKVIIRMLRMKWTYAWVLY